MDKDQKLLEEFKIALQYQIHITDNRIRVNNFLYVIQGAAIVAIVNLLKDGSRFNFVIAICFLMFLLSLVWISILERHKLLIRFWGVKIQELEKEESLKFTSFKQEAELTWWKGEGKTYFPKLQEPLCARWWQRLPIMELESFVHLLFSIFWLAVGILVAAGKI